MQKQCAIGINAQNIAAFVATPPHLAWQAMPGLSWIRRFLYFPETVLPPIEVVLPGGESVSMETDDGLSLVGFGGFLWMLAASSA